MDTETHTNEQPSMVQKLTKWPSENKITVLIAIITVVVIVLVWQYGLPQLGTGKKSRFLVEQERDDPDVDDWDIGTEFTRLEKKQAQLVKRLE